MKNAEKTIRWTQPMLERFRKAYQLAATNEESAFLFEGNTFNTHYAKYLIEYLDTQFKGRLGFSAGSVVTGGGK